MSLEKIHLRRVLQLIYLDPKKLKSELRKDIRQDIDRQRGKGGGPDFYTAFWTDAKNHVAKRVDLIDQTTLRIIANKRSRTRLYPLLTKGFLGWWEEKRRWRNEDFSFKANISGRYQLPKIGSDIKVENLMALEVGQEFDRLIYPYFSENPQLSNEAARLGLWVVSQALPRFSLDDIRILDILRGKSFGTIDVPFEGNEQEILLGHFRRIWAERERLERGH